MIRKGLGRGLGTGYRNLIPRDSYVHALSAKGKSLNVKKYSGKWYQQSSFPVWFQRGCFNVQAMYKLRDDGKIDVINTCKKDGKTSVAKGVARSVSDDNKQLKVSFGIPFLEGDYKVEYVDKDYNYAVVGHPQKKYLWILAREKKVSKARYDMLVDIARKKGYDVSRLEK